jgi:hypothetical protein
VLFAALAALLVVFAYAQLSPSHVVGQVRGVIVGADAQLDKYDAGSRMTTAKLSSGAIVTFTLPKDQRRKGGAVVVLEERQRQWWPHDRSYRFVAYGGRPTEER